MSSLSKPQQSKSQSTVISSKALDFYIETSSKKTLTPVERKQQLKSIYSTLAKYERLEVLSLLEEFLWSMKIDEANYSEIDFTIF